METKNIVVASVVGVAAVSFIGWQISNSKSYQPSQQNNSLSTTTNTDSGQNNITTPTVTSTNNQNNSTSYKDGSYSADGSYLVSDKQETIKLSLDISNNKITSASITPINVSHDSQFYINMFQQGFTSLVVGKNIDDVNLTVVNGASLTPNGFNEALNAIKLKAKN